jgi:putative peptidoglycan lipid II flippase
VELVAWALLWYAAGLVGHSIMEVLTRAFYARQDTKTPVLIGTGAMLLNVLLSVLLSAWFGRMGWMPHGGLALANSLATALEALALYLVMRDQLRGIHTGRVARGLGAAALAAAGMAAALALWLRFAAGLGRWAFIPGAVALGGVVYALGIWLLRVPEIRSLARAVTVRLRRS